MRGFGPDNAYVVGSTGVKLLVLFCSCIHLYILLSPYLCFFSYYILIYMYSVMIHRLVRDLSCEQNIYVSRSTLILRVSLVPLNMFKASSIILLTVLRQCFFCGSINYLCFVFVFIILFRLFLAAL